MTRNVRCVTPAPSITRVLSRSIGPLPRWSNSPTPPPSTTGTTSRCISSSSPVFNALLHEVRTDHTDVLVACSCFRLFYGTFEAVAKKRKRRTPSDTHSGEARWVTTKTGTPNGCLPPHP